MAVVPRAGRATEPSARTGTTETGTRPAGGALPGAAIGGLLAGALNGLSLLLGFPQKIASFEPWIVVAGCWHGLMLAVAVRWIVVLFSHRRAFLPAASYAAGVLGGMIGSFAYVTLEHDLDRCLESLGRWNDWRTWGFHFGGPVGLGLGIAATLGPARSRLARLARNVIACEVLSSLGALVFWCYGVTQGRAWSWDYWVTGLTHGAIFGAMYALGVTALGGCDGALPSERVRALAEEEHHRG